MRGSAEAHFSYVIRTLGGGFNYTAGLAMDADGNVYAADYNNNAVKKIPAGCASASCVTTLSGGFSGPTGVAVDGSGNVYISNYTHSQVQEVVSGGVNPLSVAVGQSVTQTLTFTFDTAGTIGAPKVLTQGAPNLDFTDAGTGSCTTNGTSHNYNAGDTCTVDVKFSPKYAGTRYGAAELVDGSGNIIATGYVYGTGTGPLVAFSPAAQATLANGLNQDSSRVPAGVAVDGAGNILVADMFAGVYRIPAGCDSTATCAQTLLANGENQDNGRSSSGVAVDGAGNILVADMFAGVYRIPAGCNSTGSCAQTLLANGHNQDSSRVPAGVAVDGSGNVFVADNYAGVYRIPAGCDSTGSCAQTLLAIGRNQDSSRLPNGVAVDGAGNVFVADNYAGVYRIPAGCNSTGSCAQTLLANGYNQDNGQSPSGVAVDGSGNVIVADSIAGVYRIPAGCDSTATCAQTLLGSRAPAGVAVDGAGNVLVADFGAGVYALEYSTPPSLAFATTVAGSTSSDSPRTVTVENIGNQPLVFSAGPALDVVSGNPDPNFALGTATCSDGSGAANGDSVLAGGSCAIPVSFTPQSTGTLSGSLTLTDNSLNASPATQAIALNGTGTTPDHFQINAPATVTSYAEFLLQVTALDANNNVDASYSGTVTLSSSDPGFSNATGSISLTSGVGSFNVGMKQAGPQTITATDASNSEITGVASLTVQPGAAVNIGVSASPTAVHPGDPVQVTVTAYDFFGNVVTNFTGPMSFISSDPAAILPVGYTFTAGDKGTHSFQVVFNTAGSQSVTATSSLTGVSNPVLVSTIPTTTSLIAAPNPSTYGTPVLLIATVLPTPTDGDTVKFFDGATQIGTATTTSGNANLLISTLAVGAHQLTATFAGDAKYTTSASTSTPFVVNASLTVTTLAVTSGGSAVTTVGTGSLVTLTATVTSSGTPLTLGTVSFCDAAATDCLGIHLLGTAQLISTSGATQGTAALSFYPGIGSHSYKAVFSGYGTYAGSSSDSASLSVAGAPSTTTLDVIDSQSMTSTVTGYGSLTRPPSGQLSITDITAGNPITAPVTLNTADTVYTFGWAAPSGQPTAVGNDPYALAVGDFNKDGKLDIVTPSAQSSGTVSLLLGNGDGTFHTPSTITGVGNTPEAIAVGDFNGDGNPDFVVANWSGGHIKVTLGNGDGTFQTSNPAAVAVGTFPDAIAVGDFDHDGNLDLAVANVGNGSPATGTVSILRGNGAGVFTSKSTPAVGTNPRSIVVGDFNSDGISDLAVANATDNNVTLLLGAGDGTFTAAASSPITVGANPWSIATGDFNGDGKLDLAVVNSQGGSVTVLLGAGDGTFTTGSTPTVGSTPESVSVGDFNSDGKADLAVSNRGDSTVTILLGNGDGTFAAPASSSSYSVTNGTPATGSMPMAIAAADFNGDGIADLATANMDDSTSTYTVTALLTQQTASIPTRVTGLSFSEGDSGQATYTRDGASPYASSSSPVVTLTGYLSPSISLAANPASSSVVGQQITLTATLSPYTRGDASTNGETITFTDRNTNTTLGTAPLANGQAVLNIATLAAGTYKFAVSYAGDTAFNPALTAVGRELAYTVNPKPAYVVNTNADDATGTPANCPQNGGGTTCTLRDALAAASAAGGGNITFDSQIGGPQTITLANGQLEIPSNTTITGPTKVIGTKLTNLITIDGNHASGIFLVTDAGASIANLILINGQSSGSYLGGAITNNGGLTVTNTTFSGNSATNGYSGGAIENDVGPLTIIGSTFVGNSSQNSGGAINSSEELHVIDSTFTQNSTSGQQAAGAIQINDGSAYVTNSTIWGNSVNAGGSGAGGIENEGGSVDLANTILAGNTSNSVADDYEDYYGGGFNDDGGNMVNVCGQTNGCNDTGQAVVINSAAANVNLSPLGSYGGATQTQLPLPGSTAICAGTMLLPEGMRLPTTDQRGFPIQGGGYCPDGKVDVGAVQTNYSSPVFSVQPPSIVEAAPATFTVKTALTESGMPVAGASMLVALSNSSGTVTGGNDSSVVTDSTGTATYALTATSGTKGTLYATVNLDPYANPAPALFTESTSFSTTAQSLYGNVDYARDATIGSLTVTSGDALVAKGWAVNLATHGQASSVTIYIDGQPVTPTATLGLSRPDVTALMGAAYTNAGWSFTYPVASVSSLSTGGHKLTAVASDGTNTQQLIGTIFFDVSKTAGNVLGYVDTARDATTGSLTVSGGHDLVVKGWAADLAARAASTSVEIKIDGQVAGYAALGIARPDVTAQLGPSFVNTGWSATISSSGGVTPGVRMRGELGARRMTPAPVSTALTVAGPHAVTAWALDSNSTYEQLIGTILIDVATSSTTVLGSVDSARGATSGTTTLTPDDSLVISGWAADLVARGAAHSVTVFIDGNAVMPSATLGLSRPDVKANLGADFAATGWSLSYAVSGLAVGPHKVTAVATDANSNQQTLTGTFIIEVEPANAAPEGNVDSARGSVSGSADLVAGDALVVKGWAADLTTPGAVQAVTVSIDGAPVGTATLGISRPDVKALLGAAYGNTGWSFTWSGTLTAGTHHVTATATDKNNVTKQLTGNMTITAPPAPQNQLLRPSVPKTRSHAPIQF